MANILVVVDNELNGDNRVLREIHLLQESGYKVQVLCYNYGEERTDDPSDIDVHRIDINKSYRDKLLPLAHRFPVFNKLWKDEILKSIKRFKPTFILAHDLYMSRPARMAINTSGQDIKLVLDLHENFPMAVKGYNWTQGRFKAWLTKAHLWQKKENAYLQDADKIIVLYEGFKKELTAKYPELEGRFHVFPNISDVDKLDNYGVLPGLVKSELSHPVMFYFGVVARRRGIFDSLQAFKAVLEDGVQLNYLIIGPVDKADKQEFNEWMQDDVLKGHIQHIPWITLEELPSYFDYVDFCIAPFEVNPQHESGVANKIFQYMYGEKAILASYCKPQAEIIENYECGIAYKSMEDMIRSMKYLATMEDERIEMGKRGKKALMEDFHINRLKKDFLSAFKLSA